METKATILEVTDVSQGVFFYDLVIASEDLPQQQ